MKSLASTILAQRSDVEKFFLEALQEVKDLIAKEREQNELMKADKSSSALMPMLRSKSKTAFLTSLPTNTKLPPLSSGMKNLNTIFHSEEVVVSDLSWEDKELVLKILFSKINNSNASK